MHTVNLYDDVEHIILETVRAIPQIYTEYDLTLIELVPVETDELLAFEIVFVESEDSEVVLGEVLLYDDLTLDIEVY